MCTLEAVEADYISLTQRKWILKTKLSTHPNVQMRILWVTCATSYNISLVQFNSAICLNKFFFSKATFTVHASVWAEDSRSSPPRACHAIGHGLGLGGAYSTTLRGWARTYISSYQRPAQHHASEHVMARGRGAYSTMLRRWVRTYISSSAQLHTLWKCEPMLGRGAEIRIYHMYCGRGRISPRFRAKYMLLAIRDRGGRRAILIRVKSACFISRVF